MIEVMILGAKRLVQAWGKENDVRSTVIEVYKTRELEPEEMLASGLLTASNRLEEVVDGEVDQLVNGRKNGWTETS